MPPCPEKIFVETCGSKETTESLESKIKRLEKELEQANKEKDRIIAEDEQSHEAQSEPESAVVPIVDESPQDLKEQLLMMEKKLKEVEEESSRKLAAEQKEIEKLGVKIKMVSDLAKSHIEGRLGLEARLQVAENQRSEVGQDLEFLRAQCEAVELRTASEVRALTIENQKLTNMLATTQQELRKAEGWAMALQDVEGAMSDEDDDCLSQSRDSETNSDRSSYVSSKRSHAFSATSEITVDPRIDSDASSASIPVAIHG